MTTSPTDKLTLQALKQHDKIHPRLQAFTAPRTTHPSNHLKDKAQTPHEPTPRQQQHTHVKDPGSRQHSMRKHAMTVLRLMAATRSWQHFTKKPKTSLQLPHLRYENTYRMEPENSGKFSTAKVEGILREVLEGRLKDVQYSPELCRQYTTDLVTQIKARAKTCRFPRYKLVCNVLIMENKGQGSQVVSRGLLNTDTDSFATYTFRNASLVAVAYVHGLYFE